MSRTYRHKISWIKFEEELWVRFGSTKFKYRVEALSRIRQISSLPDYQREFEHLVNKVHGWTQQALVGTFIGRLKPKLTDEIHMFQPRRLEEAISLARARRAIGSSKQADPSEAGFIPSNQRLPHLISPCDP